MAAFTNSGQDCTAGLASARGPRQIYDRVLEEVVAAAESLVVGDPADGESIEMGPVISERPARARTRLRRSGERRRARALWRLGPQRPGFFVEPTVVADVRQDAELVQEEVFGPVLRRAALRR